MHRAGKWGWATGLLITCMTPNRDAREGESKDTASGMSADSDLTAIIAQLACKLMSHKASPAGNHSSSAVHSREHKVKPELIKVKLVCEGNAYLAECLHPASGATAR